MLCPRHMLSEWSGTPVQVCEFQAAIRPQSIRESLTAVCSPLPSLSWRPRVQGHTHTAKTAERQTEESNVHPSDLTLTVSSGLPSGPPAWLPRRRVPSRPAPTIKTMRLYPPRPPASLSSSPPAQPAPQPTPLSSTHSACVRRWHLSGGRQRRLVILLRYAGRLDLSLVEPAAVHAGRRLGSRLL